MRRPGGVNPLRTTLLLVLLLASPAGATDWYVDQGDPGCGGSGGPSDPFCRIGDALAVAVDGDTIHIAPGTYVENLVVNQDLILIGTEGPAVTIVDGAQKAGVMVVDSPAVQVTGLTLRNGWASEFGGGLFTSGIVSLDECLIQANEVHYGYWGTGQGGGLYAYTGYVQMTDTTVTGNGASTDGGGLALYSASLSAVSCEVSQNLAGQYGGGIWWSLPSAGYRKLLQDVIVRQNTAAFGGGLYVRPTTGGRAVLDRVLVVKNRARYAGGIYGDWVSLKHSTVAGNKALFQGGGISGDPTSLDPLFTHTIIAGNKAPVGPDAYKGLDSLGYNLVGDMSGCYVFGDSTGNLLGVKPRFVRPAKGNYTLKATSPCIDAGDPARWLTGLDVADHPRVLDGDLDGQMVVDMGALEFDHVKLDTIPPATGPVTVGATLTLEVSGAAGMIGWLWSGVALGEHPVAPYGSLFVDLSSPSAHLHLGHLPAQVSHAIPPGLSVGTDLVFQALGIDPVTGYGNLSNVEVVVIR